MPTKLVADMTDPPDHWKYLRVPRHIHNADDTQWATGMLRINVPSPNHNLYNTQVPNWCLETAAALNAVYFWNLIKRDIYIFRTKN